MKPPKKIVVAGYYNVEDRDSNRGADVWDDYYDTIKEATHRAKYILTDAYQRGCEMSRPLTYSQVLVNGECHSDFFRKSA